MKKPQGKSGRREEGKQGGPGADERCTIAYTFKPNSTAREVNHGRHTPA